MTIALDDVDYPTAEHFMMAEKARLFGDAKMEEKIISHKEPGAAKRFGRSVQDFDQTLWEEKRFEVAVKGNLAKFGQNAALADYLRGTKERVLVEASPVDAIWGIGLAANNEGASNPLNWKGTNLLGFVLMVVRRMLSDEVVRK